MMSLTKEQEAMLPKFREFGLRTGLRTSRTDREKANAAIIAHYLACNLEAPEIKWYDSPYASIWDSVGAHRDAHYGAWIMAWDQYGVSLPPAALTMMTVSEHVWWYYPGRKTVYASEPPIKIQRDLEGRLHCETGKSIEFADGKGFSSWHGQTIPDEWVTGYPPSPQEAIHWGNMDQRAAACEIIGWHHILDSLGATVVEDSKDPFWGRLLEVTIPNSGPERFLDAICGTGRRIALPVPPETISVDQAQSVLHGGLPASILRNYDRRT